MRTRRSIAPERLLAQLFQILDSSRSERLLQFIYNLLFRWFFGMNLDEPIRAPSSSKNRDRLRNHSIARSFFRRVIERSSPARRPEHRRGRSRVKSWCGRIHQVDRGLRIAALTAVKAAKA